MGGREDLEDSKEEAVEVTHRRLSRLVVSQREVRRTVRQIHACKRKLQ